MKKLRLIPILCALMIALMAVPAMANSSKSGLYLGAKFIDSIQSLWMQDLTQTQNTVGGGIFLGYDFYPRFQMPIRVEVEYALRSDLHASDSFSGLSYDYKFNAQTLLTNFYFDFHNSTAFTPYVGAGLGLGFVREHIDFEYDGFGFSGPSDNESAYTTTFAWQVGAGVAYAFNETVSADLGYRYMNFGTSGGAFGNENTNAYASAHELSLGLRFNF